MIMLDYTFLLPSAALIVIGIAYLRLQRLYHRLFEDMMPFPGGSRDPVTAEKIRLSKRRLETTFDALRDMVCVVDRNFRIVAANRIYADYVGEDVRVLLGRTCFSVFRGRTTPCDNCPAVAAFRSGKPSPRQIFINRDDEAHQHFEISATPVLGEKGEAVNVVEHIRDITEERRVNEHLIRSEKLASIGILTGGIANEVSNPLSGISGIAENLLRFPEKYGLNDRGRDRVSKILDCSRRAVGIMTDLRRLSQRQDCIRVRTDIGSLLRKVGESVHAEKAALISVHVDIDPKAPKVRCDPSKIEQVICRLVDNSVRAVMEKRRECRRKGQAFRGRIQLLVHTEEQTVIIKVIDNGCGLAPGTQGKIFEAFFTTYPPGSGAGLGLSICHRIVEEHQGAISVDSFDNQTEAVVVLPIGRDPLTDPSARIVSRSREKESHASGTCC